jgi:hypothetical protein
MAERAVPSIPPLSSISDPNTRAVLQALVDAQRIRNGDVGDGAEKFITAGELADGALAVSGGTAGSGTVLQAGVQSVANALRRLSNQIMQSRAWKLLEQNITRLGASVATMRQELTAVSDQSGATLTAVTDLQSQVGTVDAAAQEALTLATSIDTTVKGAWSVKFDVNGYVAGVALGVEQQSGSPPKSSFVVRADTFAVGSPGANDVVPFYVQGGVTYIQKAMIPVLTADQIDTRGLSIKDASGGVILAAGTPLSYAYISPSSSWLNSNISVGADGKLYGGGGGQVTYSGIGGRAMGLIDYLHSGNASTYIASGAFGSAFIADGAIIRAKIGEEAVGTSNIGYAAVTTAKIGAAQVDTLRIAGEAVTVPRYASNGATSAMYLEGGQTVVLIVYVNAYGSDGIANVREVNTGEVFMNISAGSGGAATAPALYTAPYTGWFAFDATVYGYLYYTIVALGVKR